MQFVRRFAALLACAALAGCGAGSAAKAPVKGKVVASGQPVTAGTVMFAPVGGQDKAVAVAGQIQTDGTFVMSTDRAGDGVAIGKHQVSYSAPDSEVTETTDGSDPIVKLSPYVNLVVQQPDVEVKAGQNDLTIELVPRQ